MENVRRTFTADGGCDLSAQLRAAFKNPKAEAVVLRIESPGGSSLGSNLIYHEAMRMKRETGKPFSITCQLSPASALRYMPR